MKRIRPIFVWLHRWVGLLMAFFLIIEGVTGSLLCFRGEISAYLDPAMVGHPPYPGAPKLALATLIESAEAVEPHASLRWLQPFTDQTAVFLLQPKMDPVTGQPCDVGGLYVAVDPWSGKVLERFDPEGAAGLLPKVMPFVYELHKTLYLGEFGVWVLSILALLWTIDCFGSFLLTLPLVLARYWERWKPSWAVRWTGGAYRLQFDLHRAGGLWLWGILFVLAWSSVMLEPKTGVYQPVMDAIFGPANGFGPQRAEAPPGRAGAPALDWHAAEQRGRKLLTGMGAVRGFELGESQALSYIGPLRLYWFRAHTDRIFPSDQLQSVYFDADTGQLAGSDGTYEGNLASVVQDWLINLHMINDPVDYVVYRWFLFFVGIVLVVISYTGIYVWWKKCRARRA